MNTNVPASAPDNLKPCPFCGGEALIQKQSLGAWRGVAAHCVECTATGPGKHDPHRAAEVWNGRSMQPVPVAGDEEVARYCRGFLPFRVSVAEADAFQAKMASYLPFIRQAAIDVAVADKEQTIQMLESARPHWADGHSSDGIAAQCSTAALSHLWKLLGVTNQTDAVSALTALQTRCATLEDAMRGATVIANIAGERIRQLEASLGAHIQADAYRSTFPDNDADATYQRKQETWWRLMARQWLTRELENDCAVAAMNKVANSAAFKREIHAIREKFAARPENGEAVA